MYRASGSWLMSSTTSAAVAKLKDGDRRPLCQQSLSADNPNTLLGRPVFFDENMPAVARNAFPSAFDNFAAGYLITDSGDLRITGPTISYSLEGVAKRLPFERCGRKAWRVGPGLGKDRAATIYLPLRVAIRHWLYSALTKLICRGRCDELNRRMW
jgi:HK97 family phage major capsid protein